MFYWGYLQFLGSSACPKISQSSLLPSLRNENRPKQTSPFSGVFLTPLVPAALGSFPAASAAAAAAAIRASGMGSTSGDLSLYKQYCFGVTPQFCVCQRFSYFAICIQSFLFQGHLPLFPSRRPRLVYDSINMRNSKNWNIESSSNSNLSSQAQAAAIMAVAVPTMAHSSIPTSLPALLQQVRSFFLLGRCS